LALCADPSYKRPSHSLTPHVLGCRAACRVSYEENYDIPPGRAGGRRGASSHAAGETGRRGELSRFMSKTDSGSSLAVFFDLENLAMVQKPAQDKFDIQKVLERLRRKRGADRQEGVRRLEPLPETTRAVPRGGDRVIEIPSGARPARNSATSAWSSTRWTWPGARRTSTVRDRFGDSDFRRGLQDQENGKTSSAWGEGLEPPT